MDYQDEERIQSLMRCYAQRVLALALYLIGGDRDKAYDICAASFAEAARTHQSLEQKRVFLTRLIGITVEKIRAEKTIPTSIGLDHLDLPSQNKEGLYLILKALQVLDPDARVFVLLRDQCGLLYREIAAIMQTSESDTRLQTIQARERLQKKVGEMLKYER